MHELQIISATWSLGRFRPNCGVWHVIVSRGVRNLHSVEKDKRYEENEKNRREGLRRERSEREGKRQEDRRYKQTSTRKAARTLRSVPSQSSQTGRHKVCSVAPCQVGGEKLVGEDARTVYSRSTEAASEIIHGLILATFAVDQEQLKACVATGNGLDSRPSRFLR